MTTDDSAWSWIQRVHSCGFRIAFVEGATAEEMIAACGVDPAKARMMTRQAALDEYEDDPFFRTGETGGWGFLLEELDGDDRDVQVRELSTGRRAVSVTSEDMTYVALFDNGEQICAFEPAARYEHDRPEVAPFLPTMRRLGLVPDTDQDTDRVDPVTATLDMVTIEFGIRLAEDQVVGSLLTGDVEIDMSWLDEPRPPDPGALTDQ